MDDRARWPRSSPERAADAEEPATGLLDAPSADIERAQRAAAEDIRRLVVELELTLDARERRLLHQLRLAAESYGALRIALAERASRR